MWSLSLEGRSLETFENFVSRRLTSYGAAAPSPKQSSLTQLLRRSPSSPFKARSPSSGSKREMKSEG